MDKCKTKLYKAWENIRYRCDNPNYQHYNLYGERGIKVCKRWYKFENFAKDIGEPPTSSHSLDRIDNDKGYTPLNCRWATKIEQSNNRRDNIIIEYKGIKRTLPEWGRELNIPYACMHGRYRLGWNAEKMIEYPWKRKDRKKVAST